MSEPFSQHLADEVLRLKLELKAMSKKARAAEASRELWKQRYQDERGSRRRR